MKTYFALISAFCFGKRHALLPTFVAMDKSRCTAAAWAAQAKPDSFRTPRYGAQKYKCLRQCDAAPKP